jgi:hypothetical protein
MPETRSIGGGAVPDPTIIIRDAARRDAALFKPGTVLSGRVVQALGDGQFLFSLRGRLLVAASPLPLAADRVISMEVLSGGDQPRLRLVQAGGGDQAQTSTSAARQQALGLPPGLAGELALAAFEDAGAPLTRDRLQAAAASLQPLAQDRPREAAQLAAALALLARSGLPETPATLLLALRAGAADLPNPASALVQLQQMVASLGLVVTATPEAAAPSGAAASATPASAVPGTGAAGPAATPAVAATAPATAPATGTASPTVTPTAVASAPTSVPIITPASVPASTPAVTPASAPPATTATAPPAALPPPATGGTTNVSTTPVLARAETSGIAVAIAQPAGDTVTVALRAALGLPVPDGEREGTAGVMRAMVLAGLREAAASPAAPATLAAVTTRPTEAAPATLLQRLASVPTATLSEDRRASAPATNLSPGLSAPVTLGEAVAHAAREQAAQSVFKPSTMADYDLVMGLPLQADGRPTPARLAVARRAVAGGTATFLRVDAELSQLGPVSVRLSGVEGGALAITLMADGAGGRALAESLPDLAQSLQALGIVAGLRVTTLDGETDNAG